jgi:hypothetical protein
MKHLVPFCILSLTLCYNLRAQDAVWEVSSSVFQTSSHAHPSKHSKPGLRLFADRMQYYKPKSLFFNVPGGSVYPADMYWMGSMTTQSYNHGKIGRFYVWDVQGNLRESQIFIDISRKNSHGLKLVFSKFRFGF